MMPLPPLHGWSWAVLEDHSAEDIPLTQSYLYWEKPEHRQRQTSSATSQGLSTRCCQSQWPSSLGFCSGKIESKWRKNRLQSCPKITQDAPGHWKDKGPLHSGFQSQKSLHLWLVSSCLQMYTDALNRGKACFMKMSHWNIASLKHSGSEDSFPEKF